jgi:DnaJ-class molecular chaperone
MTNPYQVLGIDRRATHAEVKQAYRSLAKKFHPDAHPGNAKIVAKFRTIQSAYEILGDKRRRSLYDESSEFIDAKRDDRGNSAHATASNARAFKFDFWTGSKDEKAPRDAANDKVFSEFFDEPTQDKAPTSAHYTLQISFLESVLGGKRRIKLADGRRVDLTIPIGVENGQQIRIRGRDGRQDDTTILIQVNPHAAFKRHGADIHIELPITLPEAILGAKVNTPTICGDVMLRIPAGANTGRTLRLRGKGVAARPRAQDDPVLQPPGDQLVIIKVVLPQEPDRDLTKFMRKWAKQHRYEVRGEKTAKS